MSFFAGVSTHIPPINGEADHVHLPIGLPPTAALADFVNALKTGTSRRLRNKSTDHLGSFYNKPARWRRSYCLSGGAAPLDIVQQYLQQQTRPISSVNIMSQPGATTAEPRLFVN